MNAIPHKFIRSSSTSNTLRVLLVISIFYTNRRELCSVT
nr:MAG TPA: hypothetical protein [Caudoviricetes sp.]